MIARALRSLLNVLASAWLAVAALAFAGVWSIIGTAVPQGAAAQPTIAAWDKANPALAAVINVLGLHRAFTAWPFVACLVVLGVSTVVCSWRRSKAAFARARVLAGARGTGAADLAAGRDLAVTLDPTTDRAPALSRAAEVLSGLGIRTKEDDGVLRAVSPAWTVWGSAVFHWALVALMLVILAGNLGRSDGLMAVSVGQTKPDAPSSYGVLTTGPLHSWSGIHRSFRIDELAPDMKLNGIDLGAVPTVSILDANGKVLKRQLVYPNKMLHLGSLAINCPAIGLSANVSLLDRDGKVVGTTYEPIDFDQSAKGGTVPVGLLGIYTSSGKVGLRVGVTVPLDRVGSGYGEWLPSNPAAVFTVYDTAGTVVGSQAVRPGESVQFPGGGASMRLNSLGWYARLSIVDDWTTPYIYAAMIIALLGLTITLLTRQQLVVAAIVDGDAGPELALKMRLWRNVPTTRAEIEAALRAALGGEAAHAPAFEEKTADAAEHEAAKGLLDSPETGSGAGDSEEND